MRIRTFLKPLSFLPAILLMYMIFTFSAQTGDVSASISYRASVVIVRAADYVLDANLDEMQIDHYANRIQFITRKLAHMTEYFLLAVAVSFPLYVYGLHGLLLVLIAGSFCIAFACGDEYHQSFVVGRGPSIKDVGIDSVGVLIGIILVRIVGWTGRKTIFRPNPEDEYRRMTKKELRQLKKDQKKMRRDMQRMDQKRRRHEYDAASSYYNMKPYHLDDPEPDHMGRRPYRDPYRRFDDPYDNPYDDPYEDVYDDPLGYAYDDPDLESTSDELAEDMPFSHLFGRR